MWAMALAPCRGCFYRAVCPPACDPQLWPYGLQIPGTPVTAVAKEKPRTPLVCLKGEMPCGMLASSPCRTSNSEWLKNHTPGPAWSYTSGLAGRLVSNCALVLVHLTMRAHANGHPDPEPQCVTIISTQ